MHFDKVNSLPAFNQHFAPQQYVDDAIDELSLVRNNRDKDFYNFNLININIITLNTQAVNGNQVKDESYLDQFHQKSDGSRRYLGKD